jgi:hypothetical protein
LMALAWDFESGLGRCPCGAWHAHCTACHYTGRGALTYDPVENKKITSCKKS